MRNSLILACGILAAGAGLRAQDTSPMAHAELRDAAGKAVGTAQLTDTPHGVLIKVGLKGVPAGDHALHIHQTGKCEPPFKSAGSHLNPTSAVHGYLQAKGPHAGDLPNLHVPPSGALTLEVLVPLVSLGSGANSLLDADSSAIILHSSGDDYKSDPAGNAGDPIICGVVMKGATMTQEE